VLKKLVDLNVDDPVNSCVASGDDNPQFKVTLNANVKIDGVILLPGNAVGWTLESIAIYV
jgi:hypothetical protein